MKEEAKKLLNKLEDLQFELYQFQDKLEDDFNYDAAELAGISAFTLDEAIFKLRECIEKVKKS